MLEWNVVTIEREGRGGGAGGEGGRGEKGLAGVRYAEAE